jgi:hypothetical protein
LAAGFLAAGFLAAGFLAAGFLAAGFLAAADFFAPDAPETDFLGGTFLEILGFEAIGCGIEWKRGKYLTSLQAPRKGK